MIGSQPIRLQLEKILWENLVGNSCGTKRRARSQFKKGSDWWKFNTWNNVMGSQSIRIQLRKIFWENLAGDSCRKILREILVVKCCGKILQGKFLRENHVGNCCGKILQEIVAGNCCRKILRENLVGQGGGEEANLRKAVIGGNLAFGIG